MHSVTKESAPILQRRDHTSGVDFLFEVLSVEERNKVIDDFFNGSTIHLPRVKYERDGREQSNNNPIAVSLEDFDRDYVTENMNRWKAQKGGIKTGVSQFLYDTNTHTYIFNPAYFEQQGLLNPETKQEPGVLQTVPMLKKCASNLYPEVEKAKRARLPVVFLAGTCEDNEWRKRLIKAFDGKICFIDPYDKGWSPEQNIYPELAGLLVADYVVAYKGGSGTKREEKFLKTIGQSSKWHDFNKVDKITDYLEDHVCGKRHVKLAKDGVSYDYSNTQVSLPKDLAKELFEYGKKNIKDSDLYTEGNEKGRENEAHITVLYGIVSPDPDEVEDILKGVEPFDVRLGLITLFKDDKKYDVVKIDIESPVMQKLHYMLADRVKNSNSHPTYCPHATVAYIKKGTCDNLVGDETFKGKKFKVDTIVFSSTDGRKIPIKLRGDK